MLSRPGVHGFYRFKGETRRLPFYANSTGIRLLKGVSEISTIFETALAHVRASASRECCKYQCYHYID